MARDNGHEVIEFSVKCRMPRRWAPQFISMLKALQYFKSINNFNRHVTLYAEGSGDFRPEFELTTPEHIPITPGNIDAFGRLTFDVG